MANMVENFKLSHCMRQLPFRCFGFRSDYWWEVTYPASIVTDVPSVLWLFNYGRWDYRNGLGAVDLIHIGKRGLVHRCCLLHLMGSVWVCKVWFSSVFLAPALFSVYHPSIKILCLTTLIISDYLLLSWCVLFITESPCCWQYNTWHF